MVRNRESRGERWAFLVVQMVKRLPAVQDTWVPSPGQDDPLEKEVATHCSILAWEIPWTEELAGSSPWDQKELDTTQQLLFNFTW